MLAPPSNLKLLILSLPQLSQTSLQGTSLSRDRRMMILPSTLNLLKLRLFGDLLGIPSVLHNLAKRLLLRINRIAATRRPDVRGKASLNRIILA